MTAHASLPWTQRNEDKPHRCPECHSVRTWDRNGYGPRTVLTCCGMRWRVGNRDTRWSMRERQYLTRIDCLPSALSR